jgi:hypothetical protein
MIFTITYAHNAIYFCTVSMVVPRIINEGFGPIRYDVVDTVYPIPVPIQIIHNAMIRDT